MEKVHPEGVERIELDPVPIDSYRPVTRDDAKKSYTSYHVRLAICFLVIGGRVEALAEDVLQQRTPGAMRDGYDIRTSLVSVLVDDMTNCCRDVQGHLMEGREEHLPKIHLVRVPMTPHRDRVGWVTTRGEILQEKPVFGCGSKTTMDEKERRFGCVVVGRCGTEELEVSSGSRDMSTRNGRMKSDVKPKVSPG
jgi:hypothetical protein